MITSSLTLFTGLRQRTEECTRTAKIGPDLRLIIIKLLLYFILKGFFVC